MSKAKVEKKEVSPEEAAKVLAEFEQAKGREMWDKIAKLLKEGGFEIVPHVTLGLRMLPCNNGQSDD